ncbi:MAG: hypothetical protein ABI353_12965 [Isosphaeraceae bacterium]
MRRIVLLDTGPTGLAVCPREVKGVAACLTWLAGVEATGVEVLIPTIVDYEVRRELLRINAEKKLHRLDALIARFGTADISAAAFLRASELWAIVRRAGKPTADPKALDADTIIAGAAATIGTPRDEVIIATNNTNHFRRFPGIDAREWTTINR